MCKNKKVSIRVEKVVVNRWTNLFIFLSEMIKNPLKKCSTSTQKALETCSVLRTTKFLYPLFFQPQYLYSIITYNYLNFVYTQTKVNDFQTERSSSVSGSCNGITNLFYSFQIKLRYTHIFFVTHSYFIFNFIICFCV